MPRKEQPSIAWQRIYALPHNHFFKDKVVKARLSLGLPKDGITDNVQAREWLHNHLGLQKPFLPHISTMPLWIVLFPSSPGENFKQTNVPLWQHAVILADEFKLPIKVRNYIGLYILTNEERLLTSWKGLDIIPALNTQADKLQVTITVDGIDAWTTRDEWLEVWEDWVQPLQELGGQIPRGKRTGRGGELQKHIKLWAEWYELSERQHLGPAKALDEWEILHSKDAKLHHYDVSTVAKAVAKFRGLIEPSRHLAP